MPNNTDINYSEVDIDKIMEQIKVEVARRRLYTGNSVIWSGQSKKVELPVTDPSTIKSIISYAEIHADIGASLPSMIRFQGLKRKLAIFTSRIITYLSSFLTNKQRKFNVAVIHALNTVTDNLEKLSRVSSQSIKELQDGTDEKFNSFRNDLSAILNEQDSLINELRESVEKLKTPPKEDDHLLDAMYASFEDKFRGTREDIKEKVKIYLPYIKEVNAGTSDAPLLDIGCGRGEWLELLKENGLVARGVDINSLFVKQCREIGLDVTDNDMLSYFAKLPDTCLGAVTGFHIIEHLSFTDLIKLLDETLRVLKTGGVAIFETPDPQNVIVGSCNFYLDPTHRKPLPSKMMKFMLEERGLSEVEILNLHPYSEAFKFSGSELAEKFNEHFYGPQDYAVIGVKL